eukprot:CAMPEP_0118960842 /NCGR_PEP_ID=MMETSP1169-20130426/63843_1 /TAXON_ID=36882 /ORGANISM="Pyramimonas obovata, Strain CCMP722" /LENGTH=68 /DNA_ID=CAMNT_0006908995 /DNA_START=528 /DNA_END=734 /DNA_ORIENTATION=+
MKQYEEAKTAESAAAEEHKLAVEAAEQAAQEANEKRMLLEQAVANRERARLYAHEITEASGLLSHIQH